MSTRFNTNQNAKSEGVVPVASLFTRVDGAGGVTHAGGDIQLAPQVAMRPYEPPKRWEPVEGKRLCSSEGCRAYPTKTGYCAGHSRSLGLVDWPKGGRTKADADEAE